MKILKVKVKKLRTPGSCRFTYPDAWETKKIHVLAWGPGKGMGEQIEECLCVTDDAVAEKLISAGEAVEINKARANALGRQWRPRAVHISREAIVASLVSKLLREEKLTPKERRALDPDDPEPGINRDKEFDIEKFLK